MTDDTMQPFYEYLEKERQALLTKLDAIERILGASPRTAEIRKMHNGKRAIEVSGTDTFVPVVKYE